MKKLPVFLPRSHRRVRQAIEQLMLGLIRCLFIIGGYGSGKTFELQWAMARFSWPEPPSLIFSRLDRDSSRYNEAATVAIAEQLGLLDDRNRERVRMLIRYRFEAGNRPVIGPTVVSQYLNDITLRVGRPRPDPLKLLSLLGIERQYRTPILVTAENTDKPHSLNLKILDSAGIDSSWLHLQAAAIRSHLRSLLEIVPTAVLLDEADQLSKECIESFRLLTDATGTPLCLAGAGALANQLRRDTRLGAMATRVGVVLHLDEFTLKDLAEALPNVNSAAVAALFNAGCGSFRIINLILESFARLQQENPDLKLTPRSIGLASRPVFAHGLIDHSMDEETVLQGRDESAAQEAQSIRTKVEAIARVPVRIRKAAG